MHMTEMMTWLMIYVDVLMVVKLLYAVLLFVFLFGLFILFICHQKFSFLMHME